jgi:hypothetical protein
VVVVGVATGFKIVDELNVADGVHVTGGVPR